MAGPKYGLIVEDNEVKEEFQDEPQQPVIQHGTAWWKLLLCNLVAACIGAGVTLLVTLTFAESQPATTVSVSSASAAADIVASTITNTVTTTATHVSTKTIAADLTSSTNTIEIPDSLKDLIPNPLAGNPLSGQVLDCGFTPSDARAKGCVYDVMMQDWVPEPCYDAVLTERYLSQGNWTWYGDGEGKKILSLEEMRKGEHGQAWMSTSYHKAHCVFSWMKIIRALRNSKGISQELLSYDHVLHCSHGALKENIDPEHEDIGVRAPTNYARCALYEDWKKDFVPDEHDPTDK